MNKNRVKKWLIHIRSKSYLLVLPLNLLLLGACATNQLKPKPMTRTYFEYNRGKSFPGRSDIGLAFGSHDFKFQRVFLGDESFYPDNSIIPNAFLSPLFDLRFGEALDAFTEPYYALRLIHFLKKNPRVGIGLELIHFKVFLLDKDQRVRMTGIYDKKEVDKEVRIGDYLDMFNVSHGINHVGLLVNYRLMLSKTAAVPDGRLQPFASLSLGPAAPHLELDIFNESDIERKAYSYQWSAKNWGLGMGLGVRYKPSRHFGFYLEYKLTYSYLHGMHFDSEADSRVIMDFFTHHLQWGISIML